MVLVRASSREERPTTISIYNLVTLGSKSFSMMLADYLSLIVRTYGVLIGVLADVQAIANSVCVIARRVES